jgi:hypothetical protein
VTAAAQSSLSVSVALPPPAARASEGPEIVLTNLFVDSRSQGLLKSGFVGQMTVAVELWASHWPFDKPLKQVMWQRAVHYNPLTKMYTTAHQVADSTVRDGQYASLDDVRKAMSAPQRAPIAALRGQGTLYYIVTVTIETLNSNDLQEVGRWLRGEVQPAIHGENNPVNPILHAGRTILSKLMGGDVKKASVTSRKFDS